jgi:hypothetical protein
METALRTGPATRQWDATNINALKVHALTDDNKALCSDRLRALFIDTGLNNVDCKKCLIKLGGKS